MKKDNLSGFSFLFSYLLARLQKAAALSAARKLHHDPNRLFWCEETVGPRHTRQTLRRWHMGLWPTRQIEAREAFCEWQEQGDTSGHGESLILFQKNAKHVYCREVSQGKIFSKSFLKDSSISSNWPTVLFLLLASRNLLVPFRAISVSDQKLPHQVLAAILAPSISAVRWFSKSHGWMGFGWVLWLPWTAY